jgi:hypothetical protein
VQDEKTAIREILTELIEKNGDTIKTFDTFLRSLRKEFGNRFKEKQEISKSGRKRVEESYNVLLDIITEVLRYDQEDDIIQEIKNDISDRIK